MIKKLILVVLLAILVNVGLVSCRTTETSAAYKIGVLVSQTGNYAGLGIQSLEGIQLVADRINEAGGIDGVPMELVVYDDKSEAVEAALAAKNLIDVEKLHVLLACTTTSTSMAVVPVCNEAKVPVVILTGTSLFDADLGYWVFRPAGGESDYIVTTLDYINENLPVAQYAVLVENSGYGQGGKIFLPQISPSYGMEIVAEQYFDPGATDLTPQLTNVMNSSAEAIYVWGSSPSAAMAVKQAREMGIGLPIVVTPPQLDPSLIESFGAYYEMEPPIISVAAKMDVWQQLPDDDPDKSICRAFAEPFIAEYGHPPTTWNTFGGGFIYFVEDGLKRAKANPADLTAARQKIRDAFETTKDLNVLYGVYTMSPNDHWGFNYETSKMTMVTIENGRLLLLP